MQKIVVGYDGSEESKRALGRAAELAKATGASVTVVAAVEIGIHGPRSMGALNAEEIKARRDLVDAASEALNAQGIDAHAVEGEGNAADVIIEAANEVDADLIVVGTRGLNAAKRLVLGSVSTTVVHNATRDVIVVR